MTYESKLISLTAGLVSLALLGPAQAADQAPPAATASAPRDATGADAAGTERKRTARQQRKAYLKAQRNARQEARRQATPQQQTASMAVGAGPLADVAVSFRVDPSLTRSLYMGERWFSAPTFTTVQAVNQVNVDVRAVGRDGRGVDTPVDPEWVPADPKIVSVSPTRGNLVTISVLRAGETTLRLVQPRTPGARPDAAGAQPAIVKEFAIRAWNQGSALQAEITQKNAAAGAARMRSSADPASYVPTVAVSQGAALKMGTDR